MAARLLAGGFSSCIVGTRGKGGDFCNINGFGHRRANQNWFLLRAPATNRGKAREPVICEGNGVVTFLLDCDSSSQSVTRLSRAG